MGEERVREEHVRKERVGEERFREESVGEERVGERFREERGARLAVRAELDRAVEVVAAMRKSTHADAGPSRVEALGERGLLVAREHDGDRSRKQRLEQAGRQPRTCRTNGHHVRHRDANRHVAQPPLDVPQTQHLRVVRRVRRDAVDGLGRYRDNAPAPQHVRRPRAWLGPVRRFRGKTLPSALAASRVGTTPPPLSTSAAARLALCGASAGKTLPSALAASRVGRHHCARQLAENGLAAARGPLCSSASAGRGDRIVRHRGGGPNAPTTKGGAASGAACGTAPA